MAEEHVLVFKTGPPVPFTVANGAGIAKGTLLTMSDPMTAAANTTSECIVAGIAASEKIDSDGKIKLGVYREGIFKATASGSITVGDALISSLGNANRVQTAGTNAEDIVGTALETCTVGQTFLYELRPFGINLA